MAITIKKSKKDNTPVVFGAPIAGDGVEVKFGYGTLDKVLEKVGSTDDGVIYFGYDEAKNTGAIVARGKVVSSKVLNIESVPAVVEDGKTTTEAQLKISYVDSDKSVKELFIPVSADAKLEGLTDRVKKLEERADAVDTLIGKDTDDKDEKTVFGNIAKEADRATTAEGKLSDRIDELENADYTTVEKKEDGHVKVAVSDKKVVTITEEDIASAALLGTADDDATKETAFGKIAKETDRATTAEGKLDTRVTNIETIMGDVQNPDEDSVINKVVEVIDWFKDVDESETGKSLIEDVAHNKSEIGVASKDGEPATGIHKRLEDLELKKHVVSDVTADEGKYVSGVHVDDTGKLTVDSVELKADGVAAAAIVAGDDTVAVDGDKVDAQIASLAKSIKTAEKSATSAIEALDVEDTAEEGKYVSAVSQTDGKITVERAELPKLSVKTGSENFVAVDNHEVEVKTSTLGSVGLTKDADSGKWKAGTNDNATGLATAGDVAGELVSDEEVIAEAFNDHEARLQKVEDKTVAVTSADSDVAITVAAETDVNNELTLNVTGGKTRYTVQYADANVEKSIDVYNEKTIEAIAKMVAKLDKRVTWLEVK